MSYTKTLNLTRTCSAVLTAAPSRSHVGYMPFFGRVPNKDLPMLKHFDQLKLVNLKPVKRVHYKVDPLHPKANSIREVMIQLSADRIRKTGVKTAYKYDFVSDRSEPVIELKFHDDDRVLEFSTANLTSPEIIYELNKFVLPLVKEETVVATKTKGSTKSAPTQTKKKK